VIQVVTIEREYGCGAPEIAQALAERLGWSLWDREITAEIAKRLHCDVKTVEQREERPDSTFYRLMKAFMRGSYEESYSGTGKVDMLDGETLAHLFEAVIKDVVSRGPCVIVGRGAPWFLRERPDVCRVFLYASYQEKMRRLRASGKSRQEAEEALETVDRDRAAFVKRYYGLSWPFREIYHMMLNTSQGDDGVLGLILHELELLKEMTVAAR
jgi:cytidylate kinase